MNPIGRTTTSCALEDENPIGPRTATRRALRRPPIRAGAVDTIDVRINSGGGDVFDGLAIYRQLVEHQARVIAHVDGLAASIASVIAMAGDEIRISESGFIMIHDAWGITVGTAGDMRQMADMLDTTSSAITDVYAARTKVARGQLRTWMEGETWFTGKEAVDSGLADVVDENLRIAAHLDLSKHQFRHPPTALARLATAPVTAARRLDLRQRRRRRRRRLRRAAGLPRRDHVAGVRRGQPDRRTDRHATELNTMTLPTDMTTPWDSTGGIQAYWTGEAAAMTQSKPKLEEVTSRPEAGVLVPVTEELLEDARRMDAYLRRKAPEKMDFKISDAIVRGNGAGMPLGFLNSPAWSPSRPRRPDGRHHQRHQHLQDVGPHAGPVAPHAVWLIIPTPSRAAAADDHRPAAGLPAARRPARQRRSARCSAGR
jgi:ATP-dependent Clp protease protease subunit